MNKKLFEYIIVCPHYEIFYNIKNDALKKLMALGNWRELYKLSIYLIYFNLNSTKTSTHTHVKW